MQTLVMGGTNNKQIFRLHALPYNRHDCTHTLSFAAGWSRSSWTSPQWSTGLTTLLTYQSPSPWFESTTLLVFCSFVPSVWLEAIKPALKHNFQHLQTHSKWKPAATTQSNPSCFKCSNTFEFFMQSPMPSLSLYPLSSTSSL